MCHVSWREGEGGRVETDKKSKCWRWLAGWRYNRQTQLLNTELTEDLVDTKLSECIYQAWSHEEFSFKMRFDSELLNEMWLTLKIGELYGDEIIKR